MNTTQLENNAQLANLIAPMDVAQLYQLLGSNGFTEQGYLQNHPHLQPLANQPFGLLLHFVQTGVLQRMYFHPVAVNKDLLSLLHDLFNTPFENNLFKTALVANFACSFLNACLFHDKAVTGGTAREGADLFSNADIETLLACRQFGALPYFVIGDSHSRLYQHAGLLSQNRNQHHWSLPISVTCRGGSARGLANANSRFKYGNRLQQFFQRINPAVAQGIKCFFKFGQVDVEYLFNFKWAQEGYSQFNETKFVDYTNESIRRYLGFLNTLVPQHLRAHTYVCSLSLPALADHVCKKTYLEGIFAFTPHSQDEIEKMRPTFERMEIPTLQMRSRLHIDFNVRLKAQAEAMGFPFALDAMLFWDEKTGMISETFTKQGAGLDVHVDRGNPTLELINEFITARL